MRYDNYGQFDYFFQFDNTYFSKEFINEVLQYNFSNFNVQGYNNKMGGVVGTLHNGSSNNEYPIDVRLQNYPGETSTIITSIPSYYIDPKIELEKKKNESIFRLDHTMNGNLVMENFIASNDSPNILINTFIYDQEIVKRLLDKYKGECRNATLSFEKMQQYGIFPSKVIQKEINGKDIDGYRAYLGELEQSTKEIEYEEEKRNRLK